MQGKVEICGVNTAKLPILKEEEKEALFARIKAGDAEAKEEYIKGNLRLVLSVIKRFGGSNENPDDLFQIGCIGLIKAINNFNTELDVKFSTYAVPMIIGEIRRYMRDNNSIRVSRSLRDTAYKAIYAKENYIKQNLKEPTVQEIAEEIGISKEDIVFAPVSYTHLIEHNLRLVVYIAKKFDNTGVGVEDLISIGTIGLIKAINTFNPEKNIKLATYASRCKMCIRDSRSGDRNQERNRAGDLCGCGCAAWIFTV